MTTHVHLRHATLVCHITGSVSARIFLSCNGLPGPSLRSHLAHRLPANELLVVLVGTQVMIFHARKYGFFLLALSWQFTPAAVFAGQAHQSLSAGTAANVGTGVQSQPAANDLDITIQGPNGMRVEETAMVTLLRGTGQLYRQATTSAGFIRFKDVARAQYTIQVVSAGYQMAVKPLDAKDKSAIEMTVELEPAGKPDESAAAVQQAALSHQAQKELGK